MSNGGLAGGASLTNQGTLPILPGTTTFNGAFSNAAGATLRLQADYSGGPASLTSAQGFTNAGLVRPERHRLRRQHRHAERLVGHADQHRHDHLERRRRPGGRAARYLDAQFDDQAAGTITVNQPLTIALPSAQDSNEGTIAVNAGLTLTQTGASASFTDSGAIAVAKGQALTINGGTFVPDSGSISRRRGPERRGASARARSRPPRR